MNLYCFLVEFSKYKVRQDQITYNFIKNHIIFLINKLKNAKFLSYYPPDILKYL